MVVSSLRSGVSPTRPLLRYHGGKWRIAPWILAHFPPHRCYVEPFGGAGSVLLRKPRSFSEVYNDVDEELVELFRVLRDEQAAARLIELLRFTPYARREFEAAYEISADRVENARRTLIRSWMAHGSSGLRRHKTGFRLSAERQEASAEWTGFPDHLDTVIERLRGVVLECRPAEKLFATLDRPDTLFYCDPPYVFETRSPKRVRGDIFHGYRHELEDEDHERLLDQMAGLVGMVILSGYGCPLYDDRLKSWRRVELAARADRGLERTEVLWINPSAASALDRVRPRQTCLLEIA